MASRIRHRFYTYKTNKSHSVLSVQLHSTIFYLCCVSTYFTLSILFTSKQIPCGARKKKQQKCAYLTAALSHASGVSTAGKLSVVRSITAFKPSGVVFDSLPSLSAEPWRRIEAADTVVSFCIFFDAL